MNWLLILVLVGRLAGTTSGIATAMFESKEACELAVKAMENWSLKAAQMYPTDTPYIHAMCVGVERAPDLSSLLPDKDTSP